VRAHLAKREGADQLAQLANEAFFVSRCCLLNDSISNAPLGASLAPPT
jgi:hypothetical protein